jgi:MinD-like ATPase involved in chromosome partitioning or flagellar assembly
MTEADAQGIRLVALAEGDEGTRFATSLGLQEVVLAEAGWEAVETALRGDSLTTAPIASERTGQVIAVWGPAGSPGRTTIAVNVAAELAAAGHSVALADVDTHSGSVAPTLGLLDEAPGFAAACRLAGADSLDLPQLERIGQRYLSAHGSFWVLTGIGRPSRWPELSAGRVVGALRSCRQWVDYTVVDTGFSLENDEEISSDLHAPRRNAATIAALREADHVIAVGAADPVGLSRFLRAHVDLAETVVTERVTVVMNKIRSGAIGPSPAVQVANSLERFGGITRPVLVPHDQASLDAAILGGKTLYDTAAKSPVRLAIAELVGSRILPPAAVPRRRSWFAKAATR